MKLYFSKTHFLTFESQLKSYGQLEKKIDQELLFSNERILDF